MAKMSKGLLRRKTRALGRSSKRLSINRVVKTYGIGDRVVIKINARYGGAPNPRFNGKAGMIVGKRGKGCVVRIKDIEKEKELVVLPMHLQAR
ncbi:MAG: hypothetical protein QXW70_02040 [Candidatus Anstonellales archaeon]